MSMYLHLLLDPRYLTYTLTGLFIEILPLFLLAMWIATLTANELVRNRKIKIQHRKYISSVLTIILFFSLFSQGNYYIPDNFTKLLLAIIYIFLFFIIEKISVHKKLQKEHDGHTEKTCRPTPDPTPNNHSPYKIILKVRSFFHKNSNKENISYIFLMIIVFIFIYNRPFCKTKKIQTSVVELITQERGSSTIDERILLDVSDNYPKLRKSIAEALRRGASPTLILDKIIKDNK